MVFVHAFTEICCLIPCPIAFVAFAIPLLALAIKRRRAHYTAAQASYQE